VLRRGKRLKAGGYVVENAIVAFKDAAGA